MAGISVRSALEVVLVFRLGLPEVAGGLYFGHHLARPQAGGIDIGDRVFGDVLLLVVFIEDRRAIAGAAVVASATAFWLSEV